MKRLKFTRDDVNDFINWYVNNRSTLPECKIDGCIIYDEDEYSFDIFKKWLIENK